MLETKIVEAFKKLVAENPQLIVQRNIDIADGMTFSEGRLRFSLAALYAWLIDDPSISFKQFKQCLYNSQLNQYLQAEGYIVDIYKSTSKVDSSIYQLRKL